MPKIISSRQTEFFDVSEDFPIFLCTDETRLSWNPRHLWLFLSEHPEYRKDYEHFFDSCVNANDRASIEILATLTENAQLIQKFSMASLGATQWGHRKAKARLAKKVKDELPKNQDSIADDENNEHDTWAISASQRELYDNLEREVEDFFGRPTGSISKNQHLRDFRKKWGHILWFPLTPRSNLKNENLLSVWRFNPAEVKNARFDKIKNSFHVDLRIDLGFEDLAILNRSQALITAILQNRRSPAVKVGKLRTDSLKQQILVARKRNELKPGKNGPSRVFKAIEGATATKVQSRSYEKVFVRIDQIHQMLAPRSRGSTIK